jgi:hypothetical protein
MLIFPLFLSFCSLYFECILSSRWWRIQIHAKSVTTRNRIWRYCCIMAWNCTMAWGIRRSLPGSCNLKATRCVDERINRDYFPLFSSLFISISHSFLFGCLYVYFFIFSLSHFWYSDIWILLSHRRINRRNSCIRNISRTRRLLRLRRTPMNSLFCTCIDRSCWCNTSTNSFPRNPKYVWE